MANYKLLTGPFEGEVVEEGRQILDLPFSELDEDLQLEICQWADNWFGDNPDLDEVKSDYEDNWESEETKQAATLKPVSEWQ